MNTSTLRAQGNTLITADNAGERWTRDELELVVAFTDDTRDEDIAITLGRSLYAIWAIQHRLRNEGVEGVLERDLRRDAAPAPTCASHFVVLLPTGDCPIC